MLARSVVVGLRLERIVVMVALVVATSATNATRQDDSPLSQPGKAIGDRVTNTKDQSVMLWVPGGRFLFGQNKEERVLGGYWIGKNDVTYAQYKRYCSEVGRETPTQPDEAGLDNENAPMVVTYQEALDYAHWAACELPTEDQWEKAARGTDGRKYPWGDEFDGDRCVTMAGNEPGGPVRAVGSCPSGASPYGCLDMAGEVDQWVSGKSFRGGNNMEMDPGALRSDLHTTPNAAPGSEAVGGFRLAGPVLSDGPAVEIIVPLQRFGRLLP